MSFISRIAPISRRYASTSVNNLKISEHGKKLLEKEAALEKASDASGDLWRKISIFVGVPSLVLAVVNGYLLFRQHEEHLDHDERKFVPYPYLRIRNKPFPWGEETVFFNPRYNLKPEDE